MCTYKHYTVCYLHATVCLEIFPVNEYLLIFCTLSTIDY